MRVIGLTGGIGSGKSTVGDLFKASGAVVIDADQVARDVVEPGQPALADIAERFGPDVLLPDGRLDRPALAAVVFSDENARRDLEAITHPRIGQAIADRLAALAAEEADGAVEHLVVLEHPLLVETGLAAGHETVIVVEAPQELRLARLLDRGMTEEDAVARFAAQASDEERRAAATHLLLNDTSLEVLEQRVRKLVAALLAEA